jgi:hypothetical protein
MMIRDDDTGWDDDGMPDAIPIMVYRGSRTAVGTKSQYKQYSGGQGVQSLTKVVTLLLPMEYAFLSGLFFVWQPQPIYESGIVSAKFIFFV